MILSRTNWESRWSIESWEGSGFKWYGFYVPGRLGNLIIPDTTIPLLMEYREQNYNPYREQAKVVRDAWYDVEGLKALQEFEAELANRGVMVQNTVEQKAKLNKLKGSITSGKSQS